MYNCALVSVKGFRPRPLPAFLSGSQSADSAFLNRFALEDEGQQLHHILIGQDGRLFQKGLQHSGTSAKPMGPLASGQPFQFALQSLLLVLGCGQLALRNILFVFQFFQFFAHGQLLLSDNGQNKSDQLFTVDRLWGWLFGCCFFFALTSLELSFGNRLKQPFFSPDTASSFRA